MGGGLSLLKSSSQEIVATNREEIVEMENEAGVHSDNESENMSNEFNDFTVMDEFDDASAGTDQRVIRILNLSQHEKNQELLTQCSHGDESEVFMLLKYGAEPKRLDWDPCSTPFQLAKDGKDRWSPLHAAAREGHRKICQMLIKAHSPVDFQNGWLRSPMHYAAEHGRRNIILLLIHHGGDVNLADWQKYTPLHYAILRGHRACVQTLLEAGANVNMKTLSGLTPLHMSAKRGKDDILLLLLDYGSKVNIKAKQSTPLHVAVKHCNSSIVKILIDQGADLEAIDAQRKTPMMLAVLNRDLISEKLLLDAGAFAGHLQSIKKQEEWPELEDSLDEEYENSLSGMSPTRASIRKQKSRVLGQVSSSDSTGAVTGAAPKLTNKFKSASLKVIKMM